MLSMHFLIQCRVTKVNKVLTVSRDEGKELLTVSRDVFSLTRKPSAEKDRAAKRYSETAKVVKGV